MNPRTKKEYDQQSQNSYTCPAGKTFCKHSACLSISSVILSPLWHLFDCLSLVQASPTHTCFTKAKCNHIMQNSTMQMERAFTSQALEETFWTKPCAMKLIKFQPQVWNSLPVSWSVLSARCLASNPRFPFEPWDNSPSWPHKKCPHQLYHKTGILPFGLPGGGSGNLAQWRLRGASR